ncbi:MAG: DUF3987 domain-containing protein [Desulfovibrio sp.]|nr:DUF3987 domain-containing protein [Desulfovibrio sp.]
MVIPPNPNPHDFNDASDWTPWQRRHRGAPSLAEVERRATEALRQRGYDASGLKTDGTVFRFPVEGDTGAQKTGWGIVFADEWASMVFGNWREGEKEVVPLYDESRPLSLEERHARDEAFKRHKEAAAEARRMTAEKAAEEAYGKWLKAPSAGDDFGYLKAKGVGCPAGVKLLPCWHGGVKAVRDALIVPLCDASGTFKSYQRIFADGFKAHCSNAEAKGTFFEIAGRDSSPASPAIVCEGMATGETIAEAWPSARVICVCTCNNLLPVCKALRDAGRTPALILYDNDWAKAQKLYADAVKDGKAGGRTVDDFNSGKREATKAARAVQCRCAPAVPDGFAGTDANDLYMAERRKWLEAGLGEAEARVRGLEAVRDAVAKAWNAGPEAEQEDEPLPLRRAPELQAPYPVEAFGPLAGAVDVLARHCYVHPSVAGGVILAFLSLGAQRIWNVRSQKYTTPLSLFFLPVLESGEGKNEVERAAGKVYREWEKAQDPVYKEAENQWRIARRVYDKSIANAEKQFAQGKLSEDEFKRELERLEADRPKEPLPPILTSGDLNVEGLYRMLKERSPSHGIFAPEGGRLLGGIAFNAENKLKTLSTLADLWSGDPVDKLRQSEGGSKLWDRRASLCLMVQPIVAEAVLRDDLMVQQGFLPRCLLSWPASMDRDFEDVDVESLPEMAPYYDACRMLLQLKPPEDDAPGEGLNLDALELSGPALSAYASFFREVSRATGSGKSAGKYVPIRGFARRAAEQAIRIAGVLSAAWTPHSTEVSLEAMESGIMLARWHLDEALRIVLDGTESAEIKRAEELMQWFTLKGIDRTSTRQVQKFGPSKLRTKRAVDEVFAVLLDHGWLRREGGAEVWFGDGKPPKAARTTYAVRPGYGRQD